MSRAERPLDAGDGPVLRFAAELRKLRESSGSPAYRELSRRANYSIGTLSDAAGGRKLPSLAVTLAYVRACGGDTAEWTERWNEVAARETDHFDHDDTDEQAPYVGLAAFQAEDADRFFGREELTAELLALVEEQRFVAVVGPSGSGKSSLLRAGLVHATRTRRGPTVVVTPGPHPFEDCSAQLAALSNGSAATVYQELLTDARNLHLSILQALARYPAGCELLLVVDQFEEVFTLCREPAERATFVASLAATAHAHNSRARVVLGVRADFYAHCAQYPELVTVLRDAQVLVGPMTADELRDAITQPAIRDGYRVESALLSRVVADATCQPGVLPLVSHALLETWRRRRGTTLTLAGYEAAGGITEAIARTADAVYADLSAEQQRWARQLFLRLVALGDGTEDTRRRLASDELDVDHPDAGVVLERLAQARLITLDKDSVQISHEALIRRWPRLRDWLGADRERLRLHRRLTEAAAGWQSLGRDPGALYRGARLHMTRDLAGDPELTPREREFLEASLSAEQAEQTAAARRGRRRTLLTVGLAILLIVSTGATVFAVRANGQLARQRDLALAQKAATEAVALRLANPALAGQLALAAYRLEPGPDTQDSLRSAMANSIDAHTQGVNAVALSLDGHTLATASLDHTVRLWNVTDPSHPKQLAVLTDHTDQATSVAFRPGGGVLVTASRDRTVRLWNITDLQRPVPLSVLRGHTDTIYSLAFNSDGTKLASGSYDHTARLWDVSDPAKAAPAAVLTGYPLSVKPVAFSPDGRTLAIGGDDRTVWLWNVTDIRQPTRMSVLTGHTDLVAALAFSPDGHTLASGGDDHTVRLWDVTDPQHPAQLSVLSGYSDVVLTVVFGPDGHTLAVGGEDRTVWLWNVIDIRHPTRLSVLSGHTGAVNSVVFGPDGSTLASGSDDHTAQLWDTDIDRVQARACAIATPTISPAEWDRYLSGIDYQPPCPSR